MDSIHGVRMTRPTKELAFLALYIAIGLIIHRHYGFAAMMAFNLGYVCNNIINMIMEKNDD